VSFKAGGRAVVDEWVAAADRVDDRVVAGVLATATCVVGIAYATTVAGAADPYGYVSEADLWIKGQLKIPQTWAQQAPWPSSQWSFAPIGYRPGLTDNDAWSLVPIYSPGLPLFMRRQRWSADRRACSGSCRFSAVCWCWRPFGIGRRLGASRAGLAGAFLLATSPAMLFNFMDPATDVAVAGAWMVAFYFCSASAST
jgi:hypothetical protein